MTKKRITLKQLLENEPVELEVKGYGTILVREPTLKDRIEAREEAMKLPEWEKMNPIERETEIIMRTIVKAIVEPKIEDFTQIPLKKWIAIYEAILTWLGRPEERARMVNDFLPQKKEENL